MGMLGWRVTTVFPTTFLKVLFLEMVRVRITIFRDRRLDEALRGDGRLAASHVLRLGLGSELSGGWRSQTFAAAFPSAFKSMDDPRARAGAVTLLGSKLVSNLWKWKSEHLRRRVPIICVRLHAHGLGYMYIYIYIYIYIMHNTYICMYACR